MPDLFPYACLLLPDNVLGLAICPRGTQGQPARDTMTALGASFYACFSTSIATFSWTVVLVVGSHALGICSFSML